MSKKPVKSLTIAQMAAMLEKLLREAEKIGDGNAVQKIIAQLVTLKKVKVTEDQTEGSKFAPDRVIEFLSLVAEEFKSVLFYSGLKAWQREQIKVCDHVSKLATVFFGDTPEEIEKMKLPSIPQGRDYLHGSFADADDQAYLYGYDLK